MNAEVRQTDDPVVAIILLNENVFPEASKVLDYLCDHWPDEWRLDRESKKDATAFFNIGGGRVFYGLMPAPVPRSELEEPCRMAWYWPEAREVVRRHKAHLIVSLLAGHDSGLSILEKTLLLTKMTAAILAVTEAATGTYWGSGTVIQSKENFLERAEDIRRGSIPLELWIDLRVGRCSADTYGLCTTGLRAFDHMEMEIQYSAKKPEQLFEFAFGVVSYLLQAGPVIKDGDTLGQGAQDRVAVRYGESLWPDRGKVMILAY